ncbi:hypothetical protein ACYOEI_06730 [Singulisphaera rosea]
MLIRRGTTSLAELVAYVGRTGHDLTRHDLPDGVAISFLFDGNSQRPRSCQWRVVADEELVLRSAVENLLAEFTRAGIAFDPPRIGNGICHFEDDGPWPDPN